MSLDMPMNADNPQPTPLQSIQDRMAAAERAAGRPAGQARLIAVSKTQGPEAIRPLLRAGQRRFGENRVQEAQGKWPALRAEFPDIELHLIGPLQTNKARDAVALFDVLQTVDREKLAGLLADEMARQGRYMPCFLQVNIGREPQKAGLDPDQVEAFAMTWRAALPLVGLMCIPPAGDDPAPHFAALRVLAGRCGLPRLSMGMSGDFETAIAEGATEVRVGTALFGVRES